MSIIVGMALGVVSIVGAFIGHIIVFKWLGAEIGILSIEEMAQLMPVSMSDFLFAAGAGVALAVANPIIEEWFW